MLQLSPRRRRSPAAGVCSALAIAALWTGATAQGAAAAISQDRQTLHERANAELRLDASVLSRLEVVAVPAQPFTIEVPLPLDGEAAEPVNVTLDLHPHSINAPQHRVRMQIESGELVALDPGPTTTFRGSVNDVPGSRVAASLIDGDLHALLLMPDGRLYMIEPVAHQVPGAVRGDHVIYDVADADCENGVCGLAAPPGADVPRGGEPTAPPAGGAAGIECESVLIGIDVDFNFVSIWGGQQNALNRVNSVMNNTNLIYESQVGIVHLISEIIVRTSAASNPYNCASGGNLLGQFASVWNSNPESAIDRDVAHLFTGCANTGVGGIAQLGGANVAGNANVGVCRPNHYALSVHQGSLACATHVTAHELGHNWSAQHCNSVSGCSGTIMMSFFPPCSDQFSTFSQNQILNHKNSSWFGACTVPCVPPPPPNNTCEETIILSGGAHAFTTIGATTDGPDEPLECNFFENTDVQSDVWFGHIAECTGLLTVSACEADFNSKIALYEFDCPTAPGTAIACNAGACFPQSEVSLLVTQGEAVRIRVGGHDGAQGEGILEITCIPIDEPDPCPGDLTGDGAVGVDDLLALLAAWGDCPVSGDCPADLTDDGSVGVDDLLALLAAWGACPE